jgi:hypothetical protein
MHSNRNVRLSRRNWNADSVHPWHRIVSNVTLSTRMVQLYLEHLTYFLNVLRNAFSVIWNASSVTTIHVLVKWRIGKCKRPIKIWKGVYFFLSGLICPNQGLFIDSTSKHFIIWWGSPFKSYIISISKGLTKQIVVVFIQSTSQKIIENIETETCKLVE